MILNKAISCGICTSSLINSAYLNLLVTAIDTFIRAQALEGIGNKLSHELPENVYQPAVSVIIQGLDDTEAEVRFWSCFAAGALEIKETLPKLQLLAQTDKTIVAGWWSVGEEAEDSVTLMSGGEPPLRKPYNLSTN